MATLDGRRVKEGSVARDMHGNGTRTREGEEEEEGISPLHSLGDGGSVGCRSESGTGQGKKPPQVQTGKGMRGWMWERFLPERHKGKPQGVPVHVMLPLDTVQPDGTVRYLDEKWFQQLLKKMHKAGVKGLMVDVWWGVVERDAPRKYNWEPYRLLAKRVASAGLELHVVFSFHACGGNVGDTFCLPLPKWVEYAMDRCSDLLYKDRPNLRRTKSEISQYPLERSPTNAEAASWANKECISLFADEKEGLLEGRSPIQCYRDFMMSFRDSMGDLIGNVITDAVIGAGPCGELRYPSYPMQGARWQFPGIGEFMCYGKFALESLQIAAKKAGHPEWGKGGPHDAGCYNSFPDHTGFFTSVGGRYQTEYGKFFLNWYSNELLNHGERLLCAASEVFGSPTERKLSITLKLAGIHWWHHHPSHAAESTAGYNNMSSQDFYDLIARTCLSYGAHICFTCVEMEECAQPPLARCGPETLLLHIRKICALLGVQLHGENALPCHGADEFNKSALQRIIYSTHASRDSDNLPAMGGFTFLRLSRELAHPMLWGVWANFVQEMSKGGEFQARMFSRKSLPRGASAIEFPSSP